MCAARYMRVDGDVRAARSIRAGVAGCDQSVHLAAPGRWKADDPARTFDGPGDSWFGENVTIRQFAVSGYSS